MTVRPIVIAGDPVLHNPTELVDLSAGVTPELRTLIADMVDTLAAGWGYPRTRLGWGNDSSLLTAPTRTCRRGHPCPRR